MHPDAWARLPVACARLHIAFSHFAGVSHRLPFDVAVIFALKAMRRIESVFLR